MSFRGAGNVSEPGSHETGVANIWGLVFMGSGPGPRGPSRNDDLHATDFSAHIPTQADESLRGHLTGRKADAMDVETIVRRLQLGRLYADYAHCLDADQLEYWPDFFTDDCFYRVTSAENFEAGLPLGLIYAT